MNEIRASKIPPPSIMNPIKKTIIISQTNYLNVAAAYMNILAHLLKFVSILPEMEMEYILRLLDRVEGT